MTRFGMKEADFSELAGLMADVILRNRNVAAEVAAFRSRFHSMRYCLTPEETLTLAPAIMESIFPDHDYFMSFAEALKRL